MIALTLAPEPCTDACLAFELPATDRTEIARAASITAAVGLGSLPQWTAMRGAA